MEIIAALYIFWLHALVIFLALEIRERSESERDNQKVLISCLEELEKVKTRAINLAHSLEEQIKDKRLILKDMQKKAKLYRIYKNYFYSRINK